MSPTPKRNPPFRAEQVGSLLRPDELVKMRYDVADGKASKEDLKKLEDTCVNDIVKLQQECGLHAITDGEYRRQYFWATHWERTLTGTKDVREFDPVKQFRSYWPDVATFIEDKKIPNNVTVCVGKIAHSGVSTTLPEFESVASLVAEDQAKNIKLTLISPSWYYLRYANGMAYPKDVYANDDEYFEDVAKAYRDEIKLLHDAGCRNIQIDDPNLAYFCDQRMLDGWAADKRNDRSADQMFQDILNFYNKCFERPADMHIGIHLCRGNYLSGRFFSTGSYDAIATKLFKELNVDTFYLEYDNPRSGGFEPLKYLPKDKNVVLGVITSKFPELEDKQATIDRVYAAADIIATGSGQTREEALQRVSVSPQCGFASHAEGNPLTRADMIKKLQLVRSIADAIWPGEP